MGHGGLSLIHLERALQQPGCPICRCSTQQQRRYLQWLVWENVNDVGTRVRLGQSLGFCGRHARQMLQVERDMLDMTLGNSIIYDSLIQLVLAKVRRVREMQPALESPQERSDGLWRLLGRVWPWRRRRAADLLQPVEGCRACEVGQESAKRYAQVLVDLLASDTGRELYQQSDGICLPHLRLVLEGHEREPGLSYLLGNMEQRLVALQADLERLGWKHGIRGRHDPMTAIEIGSVDRAIAFLTGFASEDTVEV
jgi:hypothetical protein